MRATYLLASIGLFALIACGGNVGGNGSGETCETAEDCEGNQVCNPQGQTCEEDVTCSDNADCGGTAICDNGVCAPNVGGGPCDDDINCPSGQECIGGFCGCDGAAFEAEPVTPNVLVVLDRSGSMADDFNGDNVGADDPDSKWYIARVALEQLLTDYGAQVRFGLSMYSSDGDCGPGDIDVDIGDGTASTIITEVGNADPNGSTPIGDTLEAMIGYTGLADTTRPNYILLVTDGEETCEGDSVSAAGSLLSQDPEVRTFVIGFGGGVDGDALNATAEAGGTALMGDTKYYQADDATQLGDAFASIIGTVLSCTYELSSTPESVNQLWVYADSSPVPLDTDHQDGWDYDPDSNTITFYGPACDALKSGEVTDLAIVYGCPGPPVD